MTISSPSMMASDISYISDVLQVMCPASVLGICGVRIMTSDSVCVQTYTGGLQLQTTNENAHDMGMCNASML